MLYSHWLRFLSIVFLAGSFLPSSTALGQPVAARADSASEPALGKYQRVLPNNQLPRDSRLGPLKTHNGHFPFQPPASLDEWEKRSESVRRRVLVASGLWPMPERPEPRAVVHGSIDRKGYTVERVYLESYPGHFVTGNLYRPTGATGRLPAVMCPYGHWTGGRFQDLGLEEVRKQIEQGAERFEVGGRHPLQARCVQLARMGCLVFIYDLEGYADSQQLTEEVVHKLKQARPEFEGVDDWGFFSTQAELRLLSPLGLQAYNSLCVLDWLASLPEVDPARIAVTGGSGGATQTLILGATDDRIAAAFAAVMVSTAMQGGCTCENANCLRVGAGNVDFAALFAPKPIGMASANDWTKDFQQDGFPELHELYALFGAPENTRLASLTQFQHNYNYATRANMYEWFNEHLHLGVATPIDKESFEQDFVPLSREEMTVWNSTHPAPAKKENHERELLQTMDEHAQASLNAITRDDAASLQKYRDVIRGAFEVTLDYKKLPADSVDFVPVREAEHDGYHEILGLVHNLAKRTELPTVLLMPTKWNGQFVLWAHGEGKRALYSLNGSPRPEIQELLGRGFGVASADLLYQGEFFADGAELAQAPIVDGERELAPFTFGYNPSVFAHRTSDLLTLITMLNNWEDARQTVHLIGAEGAGAWALAARALAGSQVESAAIDTQGFRFANLQSWRDLNFLPGAVKYGDLPGLIALSAPLPLAIAGESDNEAVAIAEAAYLASDASDQLVLLEADDDDGQQLVDWFLESQGLTTGSDAN